MSNIRQNLSWPLVAILLSASAACQKEAAPVDIGKLEGKPSCTATYTLTGAEDLIQQNLVSITNTAEKLGRDYFVKQATVTGKDGAPEILVFTISRENAEALQLTIVYLKACRDIGDASQRALSFMHMGNARWKLPNGVLFTLTSSVEAPFTNVGPPTSGAPT